LHWTKLIIKPTTQTTKRPIETDMIVVLSHGFGRKMRMRRKATPTLGRVTLRKAHVSVKRLQKVAMGTVDGSETGSMVLTRLVATSAK
jgi:hypothetical protein